MKDLCLNTSCPEPGCPDPAWCPLNRVQVGATVIVRQLRAAPEVNQRLREMGFAEAQQVRVLSQSSQLLCVVCNARLGLNARLAEQIWVQPMPDRRAA